MGFQALLVAAIIAALAFACSTVVGTAPGGAHSVLAAKGGNGNGAGGERGSRAGGTTTATNTVPGGPFGSTTVSWGCARDYRSTDSNKQAVLQLGPTPIWSSGSANCSASLGAWDGSGNWQPTASTTLNVY